MNPRVGLAIVWLARLSVAGTFVAAAIPKLLDPVAFATDISNYQAFPYWSWNVLAAVVPMVELVAVASLVTGFRRRAGALVLAVLTVAFTVLIASVMARGIDVSCGCFGQSETASSAGWPELLRDLVLLVGIAVAAWPDFANPARATTPPVDP